MTQREDPDGQANIALAQAMLATKHGPGGRFSGAQIFDFLEGWAIPAFHWGAVHHLRVVREEIVAKCGWRSPIARHTVKGQGFALFGQGAFTRCKRCQRVIDRR